MNTQTQTTTAQAVQPTTEKAANLISAIAAEQANYKGNTGNNKTNANQNGIEHGLWLAGQVMQTWFQGEATPAIIEKVITAVTELQMSQTAPSFNEMIAAYSNGIRYGLFMALGMIKGAFAAELAPAIEVVKDWSNVPADQRPEPTMNFATLKGSAHEGLGYKYVTEKVAA